MQYTNNKHSNISKGSTTLPALLGSKQHANTHQEPQYNPEETNTHQEPQYINPKGTIMQRHRQQQFARFAKSNSYATSIEQIPLSLGNKQTSRSPSNTTITPNQYKQNTLPSLYARSSSPAYCQTTVSTSPNTSYLSRYNQYRSNTHNSIANNNYSKPSFSSREEAHRGNSNKNIPMYQI